MKKRGGVSPPSLTALIYQHQFLWLADAAVSNQNEVYAVLPPHGKEGHHIATGLKGTSDKDSVE